MAADDFGGMMQRSWHRNGMRTVKELQQAGGDPFRALTGCSEGQLRVLFKMHDALAWGSKLSAADTAQLASVFPNVPRAIVAERVRYINAHSSPQARTAAFAQSVVSPSAADSAEVRATERMGAAHLHLGLVNDLNRRLTERHDKANPTRHIYDSDGQLLAKTPLAPDRQRNERNIENIRNRIDLRQTLLNAVAARGGPYFQQQPEMQKHIERAESATGTLDLARMSNIAGAKDYLGPMAPNLRDVVGASYDLSASRDHFVDQGTSPQGEDTVSVSEWRDPPVAPE